LTEGLLTATVHVLCKPGAPTILVNGDATTTPCCSLSLHDALPIFRLALLAGRLAAPRLADRSRPDQMSVLDWSAARAALQSSTRAEEHTSELQSRFDLVCRLLHQINNQPLSQSLALLDLRLALLSS